VGVDVGAGTGISTRGLAQAAPAGVAIVGVEPCASMRELAQASTPQRVVRYRDGTAEALPFGDGTVGVLLVATALQWFDRPAFYREARRVLTAGGTLAVVQNNRRWWDSRLLGEYEAFLERESPGYSRRYRDFDIESELRSVPGMISIEVRRVSWSRHQTWDDFGGLTLSSTKMATVVKRLGEATALQRLREHLAEFVTEDRLLEIPYVSELYTARRGNIHRGVTRGRNAIPAKSA
jgi:ubiquinone/menaquinone biosynthesis C-methylase UbiE